MYIKLIDQVLYMFLKMDNRAIKSFFIFPFLLSLFFGDNLKSQLAWSFYMKAMELKFECHRTRNRTLKCEEALKLFDQAIEEYPNYSAALRARSGIKTLLSDRDGAMNDMDEAIKIEPNNAIFLGQRANMRQRTGNYKGALSDWNKSIKIYPKNVSSYQNRGSMYQILGKHDRAISDFNKAIKLNPKFIGPYLLRAKSFLEINNKEGACKDWNKSFELGYLQVKKDINRNCK